MGTASRHPEARLLAGGGRVGHPRRDARVTGSVLAPDHPGYDTARAVYNGLVDRKPALIVRARTTEDVVAALAFARSGGFEVSVRRGGHNVAGRAVTDGGVMIDLAEMNNITVDHAPPATATAQGSEVE